MAVRPENDTRILCSVGMSNPSVDLRVRVSDCPGISSVVWTLVRRNILYMGTLLVAFDTD